MKSKFDLKSKDLTIKLKSVSLSRLLMLIKSKWKSFMTSLILVKWKMKIYIMKFVHYLQSIMSIAQ